MKKITKRSTIDQVGVRLLRIITATSLLLAGTASAQNVDFIPSSPALRHAAKVYEAIWEEYGTRIIAALEARTCMPFSENKVSAIIADAVSNSGGPDHPMQLRASYAQDVKQATLVHELGHRHLWQLAERLDDVDGHETLYLVLERVWADVWGPQFASDRVRDESGWSSEYDYASAWHWVHALEPAERDRLWNELLVLNGFPGSCHTAVADSAAG